MSKITDIYGINWNLIANQVKAEAGYICAECKMKKSSQNNLKITVHHQDGCPRHQEKSNLKALCVICHLLKQKFLQPCNLLIRYEKEMSKEEGDKLCQGCKKNRQEYPLK